MVDIKWFLADNGAMDEWQTLEEFAKTARLHLDTARRYAREGRIPVRRVGKRYLIKAADVTAFMENAPVPTRKPAVSEVPADPGRPKRSGTGD